MITLRKFYDWLGLNKPNKYKFIIAFILILLNFASFVYVLSVFLCVAPACSPQPSTLSNILLPVVTFTYSPFYFQNELADSILYKRTYLNDNTYPVERGDPIPLDKNTYTTERKYSTSIEYTIRAIFILFALSIYLMVSYMVSCVIYKVYKNIKNK